MLKAIDTEINLGHIKFGVPHVFSYHLMNKGTYPITVNKIVKQCKSCTEAIMEKSTIQPGGLSSVDVTFTPGHLGPANKMLTLLYDDGKQLELKFQAQVDE